MTRAVDQKTYWGLGEIVMWIRTGDHERVAAMSDLSEGDAMALAMFTRLSETEAMVPAVFLDKARLDLRPLLGLTATNSDADREAAAPRGHGKSSDIGPTSRQPVRGRRFESTSRFRQDPSTSFGPRHGSFQLLRFPMMTRATRTQRPTI